MIGVAVFTSADGSPSDQGDYFSWFVSTSLVHHAKQLPEADRNNFKALLVKDGIAPRDLDSLDVLARLAASSHIDTLVTGTVETGPANYTIHVIVRRVPQGTLIVDKTTVITRTEFTDSFSETFPPKTDYPVLKAVGPNTAFDRGHAPQCIQCPQPEYNDAARRDKIQGTAVFQVLISGEGDVVKVHPMKPLGYGLDEQAFEAIKRWRFRPATRSDGSPVAVIVAVEVTFHLY